MNLESLYKLGIAIGMENDPRGKDAINRELELAKKDFEGTKPEEKEYFDPEKLWNPYADSRILAGPINVDVKMLLVGIDIGVGEMVLADRLIEMGKKIDAVLAHHPSGIGTVGLSKVMMIQADLMESHGVPINVAEGLMNPRIGEVEQAVFASNHYQVADAASLLGISLFNLHTPADNCVSSFFTKLVKEKEPNTVADLLKLLQEIPEYDVAKRRGLPARIETGKPINRSGKIIVEMTGGTTGSKDSYEKIADAGVGTLVVMHLPKDHVETAQKYHLNVINIGHMASDSLGMNIILDRFEQNGVDVVATSGFIRINRNSANPYGTLKCPMPSSYIR